MIAIGFWPMQLLIQSFVEPADMPRVFACLDVLVSPFVRPATETFGLVNIEANAMRVPFVHFGTGGIRVRELPPHVRFVCCHVQNRIVLLVCSGGRITRWTT